MAQNKPQATEAEIRAGFGEGVLEKIDVMHNQILVGIYMAPEKTKGGIIKPDVLRDEDRWQGKVAVVLKKGLMAFENDGRNDFKGQDADVGEWVVLNVNDGMAIDLNGVHCRMVQDIHVRLKVPSPEIVY